MQRLGGRVAGLCAFLVVAGTPLATAQSSRFLRPFPGERLTAGTSVDIAWAFERRVTRPFDEMELVLSLDGGKTFPLRVTREIPRNSAYVRWRVPNLASRQARLALRIGSGEEPDRETIWAASETFEIVPSAALDLEELFQTGEEWRTREALPSRRADLPHSALAGQSRDHIQTASSEEIAMEFPTVSMALPRQFRREEKPEVLAVALPSRSSPLLRVPLSTPLRP